MKKMVKISDVDLPRNKRQQSNELLHTGKQRQVDLHSAAGKLKVDHHQPDISKQLVDLNFISQENINHEADPTNNAQADQQQQQLLETANEADQTRCEAEDDDVFEDEEEKILVNHFTYF